MSTIGKIIKDARLKKGYTQEELATKVGVQKSAIAKWENGRVSEIKRSNLKALAVALELNPNTLLSPSAEDMLPPSSLSAPELELTEREERMLVTFRRLNRSQQERLIAYADGLLDAREEVESVADTLAEDAEREVDRIVAQELRAAKESIAK